LISPFFIKENLKAEMYEDMLRNQIVLAISAIIGEDFENN